MGRLKSVNGQVFSNSRSKEASIDVPMVHESRACGQKSSSAIVSRPHFHPLVFTFAPPSRALYLFLSSPLFVEDNLVNIF